MITKKTEYAIRTLLELAVEPERKMTANQIAHRQAIPPKYLPQIVSELSQAGLLNAVRGYGGGVRISRSPDQITLLEIVEAIQGKIRLFECQLGNVDCIHLPACELQAVYDKAQEALRGVLGETRLSDLHLNRSSGGDDGN
jgi:Rrf2 family nitric oxide-sensitive transcriptional repressor